MDQRPTHLQPADPPSDEAVFWMMRRLSGSMDASERAALSDWLKASPDNAGAYAELERKLAGVDQQGEALLAEEFERQLETEAYREGKGRRLHYGRVAATLAAVAAMSVIAVFAIEFRSSSSREQAAAYSTSIGQFRRIALEDGSVTELNTASKIVVAYTATKRTVELAGGEAFFNVEKDAARPFFVKTERAVIGVTGTSFAVSADSDRSTVHVLTGVVDVAPLTGPSSTLLAGDMIEIYGDGRAGPVRRYDPGLVLAWRNGKARFREEPLGDVVASLNRYFETPIVLGDKELAALPVTGEFDIRDRDMAVAALELIFNLESREEPARVVLTSRQSQ